MICETEAELVAGLQASLEALRPEAGDRRDYIGSNDSAALVALYQPERAPDVRWATAADVWLRLLHNIRKPWNAGMRRGIELEPAIKQQYRDEIGPMTDAPKGGFRHRRLPYVGATPDGLVGDDTVFEAKTWSVFQRGQFGEPGTDHVPVKYLWQGLHHMAVTGRRECHYLVHFVRDLPDGRCAVEEAAAYRLERDEELASALLECCELFRRDFWVTGRPPPVQPRENKRKWAQLTKGWF